MKDQGHTCLHGIIHLAIQPHIDYMILYTFMAFVEYVFDKYKNTTF